MYIYIPLIFLRMRIYYVPIYTISIMSLYIQFTQIRAHMNYWSVRTSTVTSRLFIIYLNILTTHSIPIYTNVYTYIWYPYTSMYTHTYMPIKSSYSVHTYTHKHIYIYIYARMYVCMIRSYRNTAAFSSVQHPPFATHKSSRNFHPRTSYTRYTRKHTHTLSFVLSHTAI